MKHRLPSASPCELACPHLSDHPTRQAKPTSYEPTDELCTFYAQISAVSLQPSALGLHLSLRRSFAMSLRRRSAETVLAHKVARKLARKWHVGIFKNPSKTRKLARKTHSFFSGDPNVDSCICLISSLVARAARTEDQHEGVRSFDTRQ